MLVYVVFQGKAPLENVPRMMVFLNHDGTPPNLQNLDPIVNEGPMKSMNNKFGAQEEYKQVLISKNLGWHIVSQNLKFHIF